MISDSNCKILKIFFEIDNILPFSCIISNIVADINET